VRAEMPNALCQTLHASGESITYLCRVPAGRSLYVHAISNQPVGVPVPGDASGSRDDDARAGRDRERRRHRQRGDHSQRRRTQATA
jgi:hypothetical protein